MTEEADFMLLIQAAQSADASWAKAHKVSPPTLSESRIANMIKAVVWESRILKESNGGTLQPESPKTVRSAILAGLKGKTLTKDELKSVAGPCSSRGLSTVLWQLIHEGALVVDLDGRYSLPQNKNSPATRV